MRDYDRPAIKARVAEILGTKEPITKEALWHCATNEVIVPWRRIDQTRLLRSIIAELQRDGMPVVHGRQGYYLATEDSDIEREARWHRSRAFASFRREQALRKITSQQLLLEYQNELTLQHNSQPITGETP